MKIEEREQHYFRFYSSNSRSSKTRFNKMTCDTIACIRAHRQRLVNTHKKKFENRSIRNYHKKKKSTRVKVDFEKIQPIYPERSWEKGPKWHGVTSVSTNTSDAAWTKNDLLYQQNKKKCIIRSINNQQYMRLLSILCYTILELLFKHQRAW